MRLMTFIRDYAVHLIELLALLVLGALILLTIMYGVHILGDKGEVAVLATLITVFGIWTNNTLRSWAQRSREKAKREFDVRKSIYLEFAEGIARKWVQLARLLRFDISDSETSTQDHTFAAAGNKVRLFGTKKTLECYEVLLKQFALFELDMRAERMPISVGLREIAQIDEQFKKNHETMTQITNYLQHMRPTGLLGDFTPAQKNEIQGLQTQFAQLNTQNTALVERRKLGYSNALHGQRIFQEHYVLGIERISPLTLNLLVAIREELGVAIDPGWYPNFVRVLQEEISDRTRKLIEDIHKGSQTGAGG